MLNGNQFQSLIVKVSGNNHFQYRMFANFMLKWLLAAMILFSLNFFYYLPDFSCTEEEMGDYDTCEDYVCSVQSQQFWLDHMQKPIPPSISIDYGVVMVCSKEWVSSLLQSATYVGSLFGFIVMPMIADNKGRKNTQFAAWSIACFGCAFLISSVNLPLVGIGSFLMGFGANSAITLQYSFMKQLVVSNLVQRIVIAVQICFSIGVFLISFISQFIPEWKLVLGVFIMIPSFLILLARNWVSETPQFILLKGQNHLLTELNKIASYNNGLHLSEDDLSESGIQCQRGSSKSSNLSYVDLFRYKSLLKMTIVCGLADFIIEFIYDGIILSLDKIGINVYLNQILVGFVEIFAALFAVYIVKKVKRKIYCQISFIFISALTTTLGVMSFLQGQIGGDQGLNALQIGEMIILAALRVTLSACWAIFFVFIAQLYPSQISSLSFGFVSIVGITGGAFSPFVRLATAQFTLFLMAVMSFGAFALVGLLRETKDKQIRIRIKERQNQRDESLAAKTDHPTMIDDSLVSDS